ncbi:MAG: serine/threonine protein kinase [Polyangiaceae bacterium]|nr:serine/threonine protein kinase [Polyangiaceae bacterium]
MAKYRTQPLPPGDTLPRTEPGSSPLSHRPTEHAAKTPGGTQRLDTDPWQAPAARKSLTGKVLANKYELGTRLGVGGMGEVYRASHLALGVDVAVKIMHPHVAAVDEYARRFRREAYAASLLHHRNVVRILDFGEEGEVLYLVMELLRGQSTSAWLMSSASPPPLAEVAEVLHQVLDAFEAAHAAGIVHRDLKPENVFLTIEADGKRVAKVLDFGLAHVDDHRDTGPTLTKTDMVSGTPEYMSPEQCRSLAVGPSTDLYAIGCLLTEMLQLSPPFSGNAIEVMTQQMFVPPKPLVRPEGAEPVPPLLERLRLSLLAKAPEQRPHDVGEVRKLLREALDPKANEQKLPERRATPQGRGELAPKAVTDAPPATGGTAMQLGVVRLAHREDGFSMSCVTGLAAQGVITASVVDNEHSIRAVLLDVGTNVESAVNWLRERQSKVPVIVCLSDVTTDKMSTLIAAGAKDIVPYPVTADVVARKVKRATRR